MITCYSKTPPSWQKNGKNLPRKIAINDYSIILSNVNTGDSGEFTCTGVSNLDLEFSATSTILVGGKFINY